MKYANDETTKRQESTVPRTDKNHPDYCAQCGHAHRSIREIDEQLERERSAYTRLIVAPHCDDESLGCGGLLAKYPEQCSVVVLAEPDDVRRKEFEEARAILGYHDAHFLGITDGYVGSDMAALVGTLDNLLAHIRPDELYLPFPSMHQDHVAGYEAGIRASRLSMSQGHWFTPSVYVYDVAAYDVNLYPSDLKWNTFEALDERHIDAKAEAVAQYASQQVMTPHPANSIKHQAESTGAARQTHWAEPYAMVRVVRR